MVVHWLCQCFTPSLLYFQLFESTLNSCCCQPRFRRSLRIVLGRWHYFMVTFTVPAEFRSFMRSHPRECYKALFEASKETLVALAKEPKYIGSPNIGATAVLHTWGRDLNYHPHLHFIVPGGAIGLDGKSWLSSRVDFLIPVLAASVLATCASERVSKGASFRLRASTSQDEL